MISDEQIDILRQVISSSLSHYDLNRVISILDKYPDLLLDSNYKITELNVKFNLPRKGLTLLHIAAYADFLEAFIYFSQTKKIPISIYSADSYLPLHYAITCNSLEVSNYICIKEPNLISTNTGLKNVTHSYLYYAVESNSMRIIQFLFNNGYSLHNPFNCRDLPAILKTVVISRPSMLDYIIDKIINSQTVITQPDERFSLIMLSIISGNSEIVQQLIDNDFEQSIESSSSTGNSAFYYACSKKMEESANLIFENMKKFEDGARYVNSISYSLCKLCSPTLVDMILFSDSYTVFCDPRSEIITEKGINILKLGPNNTPPLFGLLDDTNLRKENLPKVFEIIKLFLKKGYPIDFQPDKRNTLLGEACLSLYKDNKKPLKLIDFLLKMGASPFAPVALKKIPLFDYLKKIGKTRERMDELKPVIDIMEPYAEKYEEENNQKKKAAGKSKK